VRENVGAGGRPKKGRSCDRVEEDESDGSSFNYAFGRSCNRMQELVCCSCRSGQRHADINSGFAARMIE
jgi:hypothetical protein